MIAFALQQQSTGGMSQDGEIAIIHGAKKPLGLLPPVESEM
jgi:hypothetical protein